MASIKLYLDTRKEKTSTLRLAINHKSDTAYISLNVKITKGQWDKTRSQVIEHAQKQMLNMHIQNLKLEAEKHLLSLIEQGGIKRLTARQIRDYIANKMFRQEEAEEILFINYFERMTATKKNERTKEIYRATQNKIVAYALNARELRFEDITKEWLSGFDKYLSRSAPSRNARNIHLRNIRAVFNDAIDDEITTHYPFRKFKIKAEKTVKRSLTVEELRALFNAGVEQHAVKYLDIFKLMFYLIGINTVDLCNLKEVRKGRIEYHRAKTGKLYSIKVEREAQDIINRYRGDKYLLYMLDTHKNYKDYAKRLNEALKRIGEVQVGKQGKKTIKPLFPELSTYWARHTWATIAHKIGIPKDTISLALGHTFGNDVTDIYINFDSEKVDEANRRIIDYVLYGALNR